MLSACVCERVYVWEREREGVWRVDGFLHFYVPFFQLLPTLKLQPAPSLCQPECDNLPAHNQQQLINYFITHTHTQTDLNLSKSRHTVFLQQNTSSLLILRWWVKVASCLSLISYTCKHTLSPSLSLSHTHTVGYIHVHCDKWGDIFLRWKIHLKKLHQTTLQLHIPRVLKNDTINHGPLSRYKETQACDTNWIVSPEINSWRLDVLMDQGRMAEQSKWPVLDSELVLFLSSQDTIWTHSLIVPCCHSVCAWVLVLQQPYWSVIMLTMRIIQAHPCPDGKHSEISTDVAFQALSGGVCHSQLMRDMLLPQAEKHPLLTRFKCYQELWLEIMSHSWKRERFHDTVLTCMLVLCPLVEGVLLCLHSVFKVATVCKYPLLVRY